MTISYTDGAGQKLRIGEEIGRGGEAAIFALADTKLCAKIYHSKLSTERAAKIRIMAGMQNADLKAVSCFPIDIVMEGPGRPAGLIMPRVYGKQDVHKLYSPKSRKTDFLRADWRFLIHAAANTARAFAAVHKANLVIGDVNHGSVLVGQDARVSLIDCDSFQVISGGKNYLCDVGVETYTPPELQGQSFHGVIRTPDHDNFGLAVLIFHLLMMGRHPFSGRFLGAGEMPIAKAIEEYRFAYGTNAAQLQMQRPPGAPELALLGKETAALFEAAFKRASGPRPLAKDWVETLDTLKGRTVQCRANEAHWYLSGLPECPWCQMEKQTGATLFPFMVQAGSNAKGIDVVSLAQRLSGLSLLGIAPPIAKPEVAPSHKALEARKAKRVRLLGVFAPIIVGVILCLTLNLPLFALGGGAIGFCVYKGLQNFDKHLKEQIAAVQRAELIWLQAEADWKREASGLVFDSKKLFFQTKKAEWDKIPQERLRRLDKLHQDRRSLQLNAFLDGFRIEQATISGIGPGRKSTLASEGIETAADLTNARLKIPGFGPSTRTKLLDWRESLEKQFVFNPALPVSDKDIKDLERAILVERKALEDQLRTTAEQAIQETCYLLF